MYLYANTGYIDLQAILFQTYGQTKNFEVLKPETVVRAPAEIIMTRFDETIFQNIKKRSPQASVKDISSDSGYANFKVVVIPEAEEARK